ncbi:recombination protein RecT [Pseudaminobacter salicylatoxidans]|uniref:Recombination protein RecT n=1 Tax=Pseudaminobacter salicylatoxidans TaxID=93369 RepID=A0A316BZX7_PSESE|nr:recombinase RecT [Pseudaminobacter salicylatoxidans]PWJ80583.1 recombination protein RecT [Pseudaminobacter salicylatoxidans]
MNQIAPISEGRAVSPQQQFRDELTRMGDQFIAALPEHIKPERFQRIVLTAVLGDPQLMRADRKSLLEASMRAAQDGLLPDKREGAFVCFGNVVQWMPMIGGIIKKMHQSGEIAMITAKVVYGGDTFRAWVDDDGEHVAYEQAEHPDYDTIRQVFALAKTKDGSVYVETLTPRDIDKIRSVSRSKDKGPWVQWWEEMAKKSAIRRLAKRLPLSAEIHDLMQRDNELYDLSRAPDPQPSLRDRLTAGRPQNAIEYHEGFAHTDGETPNGEPASTQTEDNSQSSAPSTDDGSGTATMSSVGDPAAETSPADEAGTKEEGDNPGQVTTEQAAPSSELSDEQKKKLFLLEECVTSMFDAATHEADAERADRLDKARMAWLSELPDDKEFVQNAYKACARLIENPAGRDQAMPFLMDQARKWMGVA